MKYVLSIGLNDKITKQPIMDGEQGKDYCRAVAKRYLEGCTTYACKGGYVHDDGFYVLEESVRLELFTNNYDVVKQIANDIKSELNQESIVLETIQSDVEFI